MKNNRKKKKQYLAITQIQKKRLKKEKRIKQKKIEFKKK